MTNCKTRHLTPALSPIEAERGSDDATRLASGSAPTDDGTLCLRRFHAPFFSDLLLRFKSIQWARHAALDSRWHIADLR